MTRRMQNWRSDRWRRGSTALEFALVGPLLIVLVLATIEFGYSLAIQNVLEISAQKAARTGITGEKPPNGNSREQMLEKVVIDTGMGFLDSRNLTVSITSYDGFKDLEQNADCIKKGAENCEGGREDAGFGGQVVIYTLTYTGHSLTGMIPAMAAGPLTYSARVVVRNEPFRE